MLFYKAIASKYWLIYHVSRFEPIYGYKKFFNIYSPLVEVNQGFSAWSFGHYLAVCTFLYSIRVQQVLKDQYTPFVKVNQELCAWSFRQL